MASADSLSKVYQYVKCKLHRPKDAGTGWYKSFASGLQKHYNLEVCRKYN